MKEQYFKPTVDCKEFNLVDVITTSGSDIGKDDNIVDGSSGW
jgi:hypothetical protein